MVKWQEFYNNFTDMEKEILTKLAKNNIKKLEFFTRDIMKICYEDNNVKSCPNEKFQPHLALTIFYKYYCNKYYNKKEDRNYLLKKFRIFTKDKWGKIHINTARLGELIYYEHGRFFTFEDDKSIYVYNEEKGYYDSSAETKIRNLTELYLGDFVKECFKNEVVGWIRDHNYKKRSEIKVPVNFLCLKNGIFDIEKEVLLPHSPDFLFLSALPVIYDADVSSKKFEDFLIHICMKEGKPREVIEKTIQEYMGYCLYRDYPFKNFLVFDGGGDNGKTTLLKIILSLFGEHNNTSVSLQELNSRPFSKARLFGKHINLSDDLPAKAVNYTGVIKQITGGSPIWADIKNHKKGIEFVNYAKPWYACNELPETKDITDAFFSRMIQYTFLNKYVEHDNPDINNVTVFKRDVALAAKFTTDVALSGILNFALVGLKRLLKNGCFSDKTQVDEKRTTYIRKTNPVHAFIEDEIEIVNNDWCIKVDDFYSSLCNYCHRNGFDRPSSRKYVTTKLLDENIGVKKQQKTIDDEKRVWCWIGIRSSTDISINHFIGKNKDGGIF